MGFPAPAILSDEMKHKAQHSSKWLKIICIEQIVNPAITKNIQKVHTVWDECF